MIHWNNIDNIKRIRQTKQFYISRNGNFIDIFWKKNDEWQWASVLERDLEKLINDKEFDGKQNAFIRYDEELK